MSQNTTKSLAQNYTEVGIEEPEKVRNIQLSDSPTTIKIADTPEWHVHVNVTNRTDLLKDNYSEKVINQVVKSAVKNKTLSLAQIASNHSLSQNYTEERIEHEGDFDDRNDPTKRNHTEHDEEEEDHDKEIEVHDPNLTVSLTQKQLDLM